MKRPFLLISVLFVLFAAHAYASEKFIGEWEISITSPETAMPPYQVEIKYPKWMKIEFVDGQLTGTYIDQYDYKCTFPMITVINNGNDLLFTHCGTTKHPESFAPVHHAKVIDGKLVGIVFTSEKMFEWEGLRKTTTD